jgi:hypothetical protein
MTEGAGLEEETLRYNTLIKGKIHARRLPIELETFYSKN